MKHLLVALVAITSLSASAAIDCAGETKAAKVKLIIAEEAKGSPFDASIKVTFLPKVVHIGSGGPSSFVAHARELERSEAGKKLQVKYQAFNYGEFELKINLPGKKDASEVRKLMRNPLIKLTCHQ